MSADSRDSDPPRPQEPVRGYDPSGGERPRKPAGTEDVAALVRSIEAEAQQREKELEARRKRGRSPIWYALLLLGLIGNAYLWVGQPGWVGLGASGAPTVEEEEGILRYRMYVEARRIEAFHREHGALPESLEDVGSTAEGLRYRRTSPNRWELLGELGRARLVLHSAQPLDEFLPGTGGGDGP